MGASLFPLAIARIRRPVHTVVWLWEGGTLWRAKWTRRGHKEPHPSITRVDKGGLHNTKLNVATRKLFLPSPSRRLSCPAGRPQVSVSSPLRTWSHFVSSRGKVTDCSWCVSAQSWAQSGRGGIERHRETQAARRESERSGPPFLCLMRGAFRGQLAGMLRHASRQLSAALAARCPEWIAEWSWLQVRVFSTFFLSLLLSLLEMLRCAGQSKRLSEVCEGKESYAHAAIKAATRSLRVRKNTSLCFCYFRTRALWWLLSECREVGACNCGNFGQCNQV